MNSHYKKLGADDREPISGPEAYSSADEWMPRPANRRGEGSFASSRKRRWWKMVTEKAEKQDAKSFPVKGMEATDELDRKDDKVSKRATSLPPRSSKARSTLELVDTEAESAASGDDMRWRFLKMLQESPDAVDNFLTRLLQ